MKQPMRLTPVDITSKRVKTNKPPVNLTEAELREFLSACVNRSTAIRSAVRILKGQPDKVKQLKDQLSALRTMRKKVLAASKKTVDIL